MDRQRRCTSGVDYGRWYWPDGRRSGSEALLPLFDREVEGFGEVFRMLSFEEIGTSTLSRAVAGVANKTLIFAMPGSTKACRTAWENIIAPQLDAVRVRVISIHLKK